MMAREHSVLWGVLFFYFLGACIGAAITYAVMA